MSEPVVDLTPVVEEIGSMDFTGNVVPHTWFQHDLLKMDSGKPNTVAILLLADIIYWYRPSIIRDEVTGRILSISKKFEADQWHVDYGRWADYFGFTKRQVQDAAAFLRRRGIITTRIEDRHMTRKGYLLYNVVFLEPVPAAIRELSRPPVAKDDKGDNVTPPTLQRGGGHATTGGGSRYNVGGVTLKRDPNTKTPTEISTERTTTTNGHSAHLGNGLGVVVPELTDKEKPDPQLVITLTEKLGAEGVARKLIAEFGAEECRRQLEWLPYSETDDEAAFLADAIRTGYAKPKRLKVLEAEQKKEREKAVRAERERQRRATEREQEEARIAALCAWFEALPEPRRAAVDQEAARRVSARFVGANQSIKTRMMDTIRREVIAEQMQREVVHG